MSIIIAPAGTGEITCHFHVTLHAQANTAPRIHRFCPRCQGRTVFESSDKFRINANGKSLDTWLIFRCIACDERWNLPIHERCPVRSIPPAEHAALMQNDVTLARRYGGDAARLKRHGAELQAGDAATLSIRMVADEAAAARLRLSFEIGNGVQQRLDRVMARILGLSRSDVVRLAAAGVLQPLAGAALKHAVATGQMVEIDLLRCPEVRGTLVAEGNPS
jgi:hypothetical protein